MLKVDKVKKILYEYRGVDSARIPSRCQTISPYEISKYAEEGYRMYDLSEYVVVYMGTVMDRRSWQTRRNAEYHREQKYGKSGSVKRVCDVIELL